jgi:hypothetical protein
MRYGHKEFPHAKAFADALASDPVFRAWVLKKSGFPGDAELLHEAMLRKRTPGTQLWWNSHFNPSCYCSGCKGGKETDLLAVFEATDGHRFAIHVEVKRPGDKFGKQQAKAYQDRASCWISKTPNTVLPHVTASTLVLFSEEQRESFSEAISEFGTHVTIEEIRLQFPHAAAQVLE